MSRRHPKGLFDDGPLLFAAPAAPGMRKPPRTPAPRMPKSTLSAIKPPPAPKVPGDVAGASVPRGVKGVGPSGQMFWIPPKGVSTSKIPSAIPVASRIQDIPTATEVPTASLLPPPHVADLADRPEARTANHPRPRARKTAIAPKSSDSKEIATIPVASLMDPPSTAMATIPTARVADEPAPREDAFDWRDIHGGKTKRERPFWLRPRKEGDDIISLPRKSQQWWRSKKKFARDAGPDMFAADQAAVATTPHPPPVDQNAPTVPKPPPPAKPKAIHLPPAETPTHADDAWWHTHMHAPLLHTGSEISREPVGGNGINSAIKVGLHHPQWHGKDHLFGVFKAAEDDLTAAARPSIIPPGNPHGHEAATWETAHILGLGDLVPATVSRDYHTKVGSLQKYVPGQFSASRMKRMGNEHDRFHQGQLPYAAALDALIMNTDRHDGNWLVDPQTRRMTLIDHGLSFPNTYKNGLHGNSEILGKAINERVQVPLEVVEWERRWPDLARSYRRHRLSDEQISLARRRLEDLAASARKGQTFFDWLKNSGVGKHYYLW